MSAVGSIVVRRQLGRELRALRERTRRTRDDVAAASIASVAKMARIEAGQTPVRPGDVRELCRLYGVDAETTDNLAVMAQATKEPSWWEEVDAKAPRWFGLYLNLEAVASELHVFEPSLVHGLFQTADYARAIARRVIPDASETAIEGNVVLRLARQRSAFDRPDPLRVTAVLGEPALALSVGSPALRASQMAALRERAALAHVEVRVLPLAAGPHPGYLGQFSILDFANPDDPPVAYVETYDAARYPEVPAHVARYRRRFAAVHEMSVPLEEWLR
ncbi:MAG: helix-turn-helix domain-containing protein [Actinobacteria bacterium]|nr:helix-turn-helix domain-containing protein [Actinomycetota bacterium]MBI3687901.1 helix-turn-helix domain-containing protein [Actinomycetota bacterium]